MATKKHTSTTKKEKEESAFLLEEKSVVTSHSFETKKIVILVIGAILTLCVIIGIALYYYLQYQKTQELLRNPVLASEKEQETLVERVSQLTQLPNEQPTIAKVSDSTKLQGQPFFQHAKNGDIVFIYPNAKEAILYDPVVNKIVQVGPISSNQSVQGAATTSQQTSASVSVALYNGTNITGLTKKVAQELAQQMTSATVVANANASRHDYTQTIVVDLTGKHAAASAQLAAVLKGTVGNLPKGEIAPPNAEILVILGKG